METKYPLFFYFAHKLQNRLFKCVAFFQQFFVMQKRKKQQQSGVSAVTLALEVMSLLSRTSWTFWYSPKKKETENSDISVTSFFVQTLLRNLQLQEVQLKEVVKQKKHVDQNSQFRQREKKQFWSSSLNRLLISSDAYLAKIVSEKRLTLITAWEESEKARAENR